MFTEDEQVFNAPKGTRYLYVAPGIRYPVWHPRKPSDVPNIEQYEEWSVSVIKTRFHMIAPSSGKLLHTIGFWRSLLCGFFAIIARVSPGSSTKAS